MIMTFIANRINRLMLSFIGFDATADMVDFISRANIIVVDYLPQQMNKAHSIYVCTCKSVQCTNVHV